LSERRELADQAAVARMLRRMAHEIVEKNRGAEGIALVGIRTGGLHLAERLQALIRDIEGTEPPLGAVDISLYRDDVFNGLPRPVIGPTELPFELEGVRIVLVDDVLYTGRTVRAALDALMDYGRPRAVELAVLIDRGLRELPIRADYVGMSVETTPDQSVKVLLGETGQVSGSAAGQVSGSAAGQVSGPADRVVLRSRSAA
jgi:pyrimidine operon attenuation protein / uracil phosphoribosyltransferase